MRATLKNTMVILTLAGLTLTASAAMGKGGNNGSGGSSGNSSKSFSRSFKSMGNSNSGNSSASQSLKNFQAAKVIKSQGIQTQQLNSNKVKVQKFNGIGNSNNGNSNNIVKMMPKVLDKGIGNGGIGNGQGSKKVLDPGFNKNKGNKQNFCKDFGKNKCFDNHCWPWWITSNCHKPCYDPCYDSCYYGCFTPYYTTTVVEVPVVVQQPVLVQPAVGVEQPLGVQQVAAQAEAPAAGVEAPAGAGAEARAAELMKVPVGATITLNGEAFGEKPGRVAMQVGELLLGTQVTKWDDKAVVISVPQVGLAAAAKAKFLILKADNTLASEIPFELILPQAPAVGQK